MQFSAFKLFIKCNLIFVFFLAILANLFLTGICRAEDEKTGILFRPQVTIGGEFAKCDPENKNCGILIDDQTMGRYIQTIYKYGVGTVGILATVAMMIGGLLWATAAGNKSRIDTAKSWLASALTGLVLALGSYTLLYFVNPNLTVFEPLKIDKIENLGCCIVKNSSYNLYTQKKCETVSGEWGGDGSVKYGADRCLTADAEGNLKYACVKTNPITLAVTCADTTQDNCPTIINGAIAAQIWKEGKLSADLPDCKSSSLCSAKSKGDQCGPTVENPDSANMCYEKSGILTCGPCVDTKGNPCTNDYACCAYAGLSCSFGVCSDAPEKDCADPANDKLFCGTGLGGEDKVCSKGSCKICEKDEGDWCTLTPCCEGITCCDIPWALDKCYAVCPGGRKNGETCNTTDLLCGDKLTCVTTINGQFCTDGQAGSPCGSDSQCQAGLICRETIGLCSEGKLGDSCDNVDDCQFELDCLDNKCDTTGCCVRDLWDGSKNCQNDIKETLCDPLVQLYYRDLACNDVADCTSPECVSKSAGDQCEPSFVDPVYGKMCYERSGQKTCGFCWKEAGNPCLGDIDCCAYADLSCNTGSICDTAPTIDCSDPDNDKKSCSADIGKKVCAGGVCKTCENTEGDWCNLTPCCQDLECCHVSLLVNKCYAVCPGYQTNDTPCNDTELICAEDLVCVDTATKGKLCTDGAIGSPCGTGGDCSSGLCRESTGVCAGGELGDTCDDASDCAGGSDCLGGYCDISGCCAVTQYAGSVSCSSKTEFTCPENLFSYPYQQFFKGLSCTDPAMDTICSDATECDSKSAGDSCGSYSDPNYAKMCYDRSGTLSCDLCAKNEWSACGYGIDCCSFSGLTCYAGYCQSAPSVNCSLPGNDGLSCGDQRVCSDGDCLPCEQDEGGWCTFTPCCNGLKCCDIPWLPDECHATCP